MLMVRTGLSIDRANLDSPGKNSTLHFEQWQNEQIQGRNNIFNIGGCEYDVGAVG